MSAPLDERLADALALRADLANRADVLAGRRLLCADRLTWLESERRGLAYPAQSDSDAARQLALNEELTGAVKKELTEIDSQLGELQPQLAALGAEIRQLQMAIKKRDFHTSRLQTLQAFRVWLTLQVEVAPAKKQAESLNEQTKKLSYAFQPGELNDGGGVSLPPGELSTQLSYLAEEIQRESQKLMDVIA